jgi:hypothetical protein
MLYPKVVGQSGTANPAPLLVTRPPINNNGNVAHAVITANRWGHTETSDPLPARSAFIVPFVNALERPFWQAACPAAANLP